MVIDMEKFEPRMLFETESAKGSEHKFAMYKSFNEYIICDLFEKDAFLKAGYSTNPSSFIKHVDRSDSDKALDILKEANAKRNASIPIERPKRKPATGKIIDDDGNSLAVDEHGNEYILNKQVVI